MVATDATLSFPDRRVADRCGLPSRRSGLARRDQRISVPLERRGGGERRILADRRSWTERRRAPATTPHVPAGAPLTGAPRTRKFAVDLAEYPFADRWLERGGSALHYVDEGSGLPVLMLHGNPTWSFLYRNVIKQLGGACRAIAPDYRMCGHATPGDELGRVLVATGYPPVANLAVRISASPRPRLGRIPPKSRGPSRSSSWGGTPNSGRRRATGTPERKPDSWGAGGLA